MGEKSPEKGEELLGHEAAELPSLSTNFVTATIMEVFVVILWIWM